MATIVCDCDGTFFKWGTTIPCDQAFEKISESMQRGTKILFITRRSYDQKLIDKLNRLFGEDQYTIVFDFPSPRIMFNDEVLQCVRHPQDGSWKAYNLP